MTNKDSRILNNNPIYLSFSDKIKSFKFKRGGYGGNYQVFEYKATKTKGRKLSYKEEGEYEVLFPCFEMIVGEYEFDYKDEFDYRLKSLISYFTEDFGTNPGVMDGEWFEFTATLSDGKKIKSGGCNYFPKTYYELIEFLEQTYQPLTIDEKCQKLPILKTQKIEYIPGKVTEKDVIYIGSYNYPEDVREWYDKMYNLDLIDKTYGKNFALINDKDINTLSRDEILTFFTFILRGEHFGAGEITDSLENGELEILSKRLYKLTSPK